MDKINFIGKENIICTEHDWKNMDREEKVKKECAEKNKQKGMTPIQHRNVWLHIKATTEQDDRK